MHKLIALAGLASLLMVAQTNADYVTFMIDVDDYASLSIDGVHRVTYDSSPQGQAFATLDLTPGWHDIRLDYANRWGTAVLVLSMQYDDAPGYAVVPRSHLRSLGATGNWIEGLLADYGSFTIYGEGPINHDDYWGRYQGQPGLWGGVYGPWSVISETLTGQVLIGTDTVSPPRIEQQPSNRTIAIGKSATLSVRATGAAPLSYQWYAGLTGNTSQPITDAVNASYTTPPLGATTSFWVRVANALGSVDSDTATVIVIERSPPNAYLYFASSPSQSIKRFDAQTGAFVDDFASVGSVLPQGVKFGPDGHLYVSSINTGQVLRYDGITGAFMDVFASGSGLSNPAGLAFGPEGDLYVGGANAVQRFDGTTGAFIDTFATLPGIGNSLAFGSDGNLYLSRGGVRDVVRFDRVTKAFLGTFASGNGLTGPLGITFGPDGNLYVGQNKNPTPSDVLRFDGRTGAYLGVFTTGGYLIAPWQLAFGPDGDLYVSSHKLSATGVEENVQRFNGTTGEFMDVFVRTGQASGSGHYFTFGPPTAPPVITAQPASTTVMEGDSANLCVAASGPEPIFYQWYQGQKGDTANPVDGAILRCYEAKNLTATVSYWIRVFNPAGSADSDTATLTVKRKNQAPVAVADSLVRTSGQPGKVAATELVADDTDADGDSLTIVAVSALSPNGAAVTLADGWVSYDPPAGFDAEDTFTYTVDDGYGGQAQGEVRVTVQTDPPGPSGNLLPPAVQSDGTVRLSFAGVPGRPYRVQQATRLDVPDWAVIGNVLIGKDGSGEFEDPSPLSGDRFYRTVYP